MIYLVGNAGHIRSGSLILIRFVLKKSIEFRNSYLFVNDEISGSNGNVKFNSLVYLAV